MPVQATKASAAPTVRMNRNIIEANDTHPPVITTDPMVETGSRSRKGLKMPMTKANGAARMIFRAR